MLEASSGSPKELIEGEEVTLSAAEPGLDSVRIRCQRVTQRNWSRVAVGELLDGSGLVFLKQYVDGAGRPQYRHWDYERQGSGLMARVLKPGIEVPGVVASSDVDLLHAFEYRSMISVDVLLRTDPAAFNRVRPRLFAGLCEVIDSLRSGPSEGDLPDLPVKVRPFGVPPWRLNFKGLDFRNLGVATGSSGGLSDGLYLFDIGRPYFGPIEEAAAKLVVTVGLMNWGRPLSRFRLGPDLSLLDEALEALRPSLVREALITELEREEALRLGTPQAQNIAERIAKSVGIQVLGRRYLREMRRRFQTWEV